MKLLRESERDLKLDIASARAASCENSNSIQDCNYPKTPGYQIECSKPFMSLMCRTFPCNRIPKSGGNRTPNCDSPVKTDNTNGGDKTADDYSCSKIEFYQTLKALIRMGSGDKYLDRNTRRAVSIINFSYIFWNVLS